MNAACDSELEASWLLQNLKCIRRMYASLIHLDLPSDALDIFENFIFDLRYCYNQVQDKLQFQTHA